MVMRHTMEGPRSYDEDLRRRQEEHLKKVKDGGRPFQPCKHDGCSQCHGTGVRVDGGQCVHSISCPCPKCNPARM